MKKILFATTAIVGFAGAASAQNVNIEISGEAEMGIFSTNENITIGGNDYEVGTNFWQDIEVEFSMTGESDSGISFGAVIQLDEAVGPQTDDNGARVFISGAFGTLTMGDTDGALDWALTEAGNVGNPGSIADDETIHAGYNGAYNDGFFDNQVLRYDYSFDTFSVAISYEQGAGNAFDVTDTFTAVLPDGIVGADSVGDGTLAIGAKYALDFGGTSINLGAGFSNTDVSSTADIDIWGISADAEFGGGFSAGIVYSDWDIGGADASHTGLGLGYENGPIAVHANYGVYNFDGIDDVDGFGMAAAYDLGGGLSAKLGYGTGDDDIDTWSFGMAMEF